MNTSNNTPNKILIPLLALGLITVGTLPTLRAQDQNTSAPSTNSSAGGEVWRKGPHHRADAWAKLNKAERQQLKAAMGKIKDDPQLVAAREVVKNAETRKAKRAAYRSLVQLRHDLLLKADPTIQPILDKMHKEGAGELPESN